MSTGSFSLRDLLGFPVSRRWVYTLFTLIVIIANQSFYRHVSTGAAPFTAAGACADDSRQTSL